MRLRGTVFVMMTAAVICGQLWGGSPRLAHQLAQIGVGGGIQSVLLVLNDGEEEALVTLDIFRDDGSPLEVTIDDQTASSFELKVPGRGTARFVLTSASPNPVAGWSQLVSSLPVAVQLLFEIRVGGDLVTQAAVEPLGTTQAAHMFVDTELGNTGVALANVSFLGPVIVQFTLKNEAGETIATTQQEIVARGHLAKFVSELFPQAAQLRGSLEVLATGRIVLVTLQQTGLVLGTLPVITPSMLEAGEK